MNIYFYCKPQGQGRKPAYQFNLIYLAEGLRQWGYSIYANIDYWQLGSGEYLFTASPGVDWRDCDAVVVSSIWEDYGGDFPAELLQVGGQAVRVLIDTFDGWHTSTHGPAAHYFDLILKQMVRHASYPHPAVVPWAFGFGQFVADFFATVPEFSAREAGVLANYRNMHPFRRLAEERLLPRLEARLPVERSSETLQASPESVGFVHGDHQRAFEQSGHRHHPAYLKRMADHQLCSAFGGWVSPSKRLAQGRGYRLAPYLYRGYGGGRISAQLERLGWQIKHAHRIHQWDSWRLWESWVGGCIPLHVDLNVYGALLPEMPVNWQHYIGVDFGEIDRDVDRLLHMSEAQLANIATAGRAWALQHYSPKAVADRFVRLISSL